MKKISKINLILGACSMFLFMIGDWLLDALGAGNEEIGLIVESNWSDMSMWRFVASATCAAIAITFTWLGSKELLKIAKSVDLKQTKISSFMNGMYRYGVVLLVTISMGFHIILCLFPMVYKLIIEETGNSIAAINVVNTLGSYVIVQLMILYLIMDIGGSIGWYYLILKKQLALPKWALFCCPLSTLIIDFILKLIPLQFIQDFTVAFESLGWMLMFIAGYYYVRKKDD